MKRLISQVVFLVLAAAVFSVARNAVAPGGIDWVGDWEQRDSVLAAVAENPEALPPSAQPDDPPFLNLPQAQEKFESGAIFIDAREPEEYTAGHIEGALRLPFERFDEYWPFVEPVIFDSKDKEFVTYCSGAECELSLFLARHLRTLGYNNVSIFFGGWSQWQENGGPIATGDPGAEPQS